MGYDHIGGRAKRKLITVDVKGVGTDIKGLLDPGN